MRMLKALLILLLFAGVAYGQTTTVTLQVTDAGAQTWNNGTYTIKLISTAGGVPPQTFYLGGTAMTAAQVLQTGSLSAGGGASPVLGQTASITPITTTWQYTICPQATAACYTANQAAIGATQNVTLTPPAISVPPGNTNLVYSTGEVSNPQLGSTVFLIGSGLQTCTAVTGAACTSWSGGGGVTGYFNVKSYGAIGDARHTNTAVANQTTTLTDATSTPWVASDVGKLIVCNYSQDTNQFPAGTTIVAFVNSGQITVSHTAQGNNPNMLCTWATQDDQSAFVAAYNAALASGIYQTPAQGSPTLGFPSAIYVPPGGYLLGGNIYDANGAGQALFPSFIGAGASQVTLYPRNDTFTSGPRACLMDAVGVYGITWSGFTIWGNGHAFSCTSSNAVLLWNQVAYSHVSDVQLQGTGNTSATAVWEFYQSNNNILENANFFGGSTLSAGNTPIVSFNNLGGFLVLNAFVSNNPTGPNVIITGSGARNASGQQFSWIGGGSDECGGVNTVGYCVLVQSSSVVNLIGGSVFGEPVGAGKGALEVDGTSSVYLSSENIGPFSTNSNSTGLEIASGGYVYATGSHIRGGGTTGPAVDGPSGANFIDDGGNFIQRCAATVCTTATPANFSGFFTSGVNPKASLTHTPNTCYVTLAAFAAVTLCNAFMDQNYQILHIKASSSTSTTCATAPVVTLTDGTQSATLTITTGKTSWDSSVDTSTGINNIFASGNTMTVSTTAGTCATPPTNFSLTYSLQSVLNQ
jgi:hypothetical protein